METEPLSLDKGANHGNHGSPGRTSESPSAMNAVTRSSRSVWPFVSVSAASLILGAVSLIYPFGRDQGVFAFMADSLLSGRVMYRDVLDIKPPLTPFVHVLALLLFGHSMTAIRILDLIWTSATALVLCAFARRAFRSDLLGAIAGGLYPYFYVPLGFWTTAQTDGWLNLPVAGALALFLVAQERETRRARLFLLGTGLCCGLAVLFKYTVGALPLLLTLVLLVGRRANLRDAAASAAWLLLGVLMPLLLCAIALLAYGAMPAFVENQFGLVPAYARIAVAHGLFGYVTGFVHGFTSHPGLRLPAIALAAGAVTGLLLYRRRPDWRVGLLLAAAWLAVAAGSTFSQGKFFVYHYLPLLPAAAVGAALTAGLLLTKLKRGRVLAGTTLAALLFVVAGFPARFEASLRILSGRQTARDKWVGDPQYEGSDFSLRDDIELADYLREFTSPHDRVFIWGFEPAVYFLARRNTVTRFIDNVPMVVEYERQRYRAEFIEAFAREPAEVFIVEHGDSIPEATGVRNDSYGALLGFPELVELLRMDYHAETRVGRFDVLRRNLSP